MVTKKYLLLTLLIGLFIARVEGCTGMRLLTADGKFVHGRTLEFGIDLDPQILFVPKESDFFGTTQKGKGLLYKAKYSAVGAMAVGMPLLMDGINEKGLAAGVFYFPGFADYTALTEENLSKALAPTDLCHWILTQFSTVEEVRAALQEIVVVNTSFAEWGGMVPPFHYIVYDIKGSSIVIEPLQGELLVYDNPLGILTNSPDFPWHITNLRNYIDLSPENVKARTLKGITLEPFGQGSGMVGLPGDFTPPSRFVRAFAFSQAALPPINVNEAVYELFHLLNQFDIPKGVIREKSEKKTSYDYTSITCVRDPFSLRYFFKTYDDQTVKVVNLKSLVSEKVIKKGATKAKETAVDITGTLKG